MKIKYTVGKKSLEVDYFPREKGEYLSREEDYIFDAALNIVGVMNICIKL